MKIDVSRRLQNILGSNTCTKFGTWYSSSYSSLNHGMNKSMLFSCSLLERLFHECSLLTTITILPVRDPLALEINCPTTHAEFLKGNFVKQFSALAHYQVHEQLNAMVKEDEV